MRCAKMAGSGSDAKKRWTFPSCEQCCGLYDRGVIGLLWKLGLLKLLNPFAGLISLPWQVGKPWFYKSKNHKLCRHSGVNK